MAEQTRTRLVPGFITLSLLATIGAALGGLGGCSSNSEASGSNSSDVGATDASIGCTSDPRGEDFTLNLTHKGDSGMLSFVIVGANDIPPAVDNNTWTLKILDANGQAVSDAVLSFPATVHPSDPWMPDHSHGALPAKAVNNKDGTYTVAPLYFFMGGIWSTYIQANVGSVTDSTTFTFCVNS
jgi:YtkA-like